MQAVQLSVLGCAGGRLQLSLISNQEWVLDGKSLSSASHEVDQ
jgi:hypothetical protein